jgi:hypothetical protein
MKVDIPTTAKRVPKLSRKSNEWGASERIPLRRKLNSKPANCGHQKRYVTAVGCVQCQKGIPA